MGYFFEFVVTYTQVYNVLSFFTMTIGDAQGLSNSSMIPRPFCLIHSSPPLCMDMQGKSSKGVVGFGCNL